MRMYLAVLSLAVVGRGNLGLLALVCWFLLLVEVSDRQADLVWRVILWASIGCALLALVQLPWIGRPPGPFGSPNYLGAFAAVMFHVAWQRRHRVIAGANLAAVALSQSRGAILAVGAGLVAVLWRRSRWLSGAIGAVAVAGAVILHRPDARLQVWQIGLHLGLARPLTGWGIDHPDAIGTMDGHLAILSHFWSVPLDWFVATGLLGCAAGFWLLVEIGRQAAPERRATFIAWMTAGLFLSGSWPTWIVLFALLADLVRRDVAHRVPVVDPHHPFLDGGVRSLRAEGGHGVATLLLTAHD